MTTRGGSHAMRPTGSPRWGRRALLVGGVAVAGYAGFAVWPRSEGDPSPTPPTTSAPEATDSASPSGSTAAGRFPGDPGDKVYLGVSLSIDQPLSEKAAEIGSSPTMTRRFYKDHQVGLMSSMATQDIEQGALPFLSVKVPGSWASVAQGERDEWLDGLLAGLDAAGGPIFLALHHEPENDSAESGHSPEAWQEMQRRARDRAARKAPQVTVVPVLMQWTFNPDSGRDPREWVPKDFPLLGVDIYNIWSPTDDKIWNDFAQLFNQVRAELSDEQAIVVPELGTPQDPLDPQRASQWLRDAYNVAAEAGVVGLAWFDSPFSDPTIGDTRLGDAGDATIRELIDSPRTARLGQ
ncbi:MAG: hypothetical protein V9F00_01270 [Nocardioides sp.]